MLRGGQGRSLKLNRFFGFGKGANIKVMGPSIVDSSPGENVSIVDPIELSPQESDAQMP